MTCPEILSRSGGNLKKLGRVLEGLRGRHFGLVVLCSLYEALKKERRAIMKVKSLKLLSGVLVLILVLLTGYGSVSAASPTGEVRTVGGVFGNQIPIPYLEMAHANDWMDLLYDHLVGYTPDGKFSRDLGLANRWEMSPDGLTWTFYLRKGVKFHDGVEVTAKDVKFSIEQFMLPDSSAGEGPFLRQNVKGIDVKDPYTVTIHLNKPDIFLIYYFVVDTSCGMIVPKDYYERVGKDAFAKRPIGSGPYKWHSQQVGSFIKLEATERHWRDGIPKYKHMIYLIIPEESTRLAMLRTGEADIARISREAVKEALNAGLNVGTKESFAVVVLHPNMQWASPVFSDIRFRKALNLAIDKGAIIKNLFAGLAKPIAGYPGPTISAVGGDTKLKPYPYDPQEARRLIKEGGWEGHEFTLISYPREGCPEYPLMLEAIVGYWQKIGLNPNIRATEYAVWRKAWAERKTQNTIHGYEDVTRVTAYGILSKFVEKWSFAHKSGRSTVNIPELNERFERIEKSLDIDEISKLLSEIYRYAYDNYLMIPICEIPDKIATTKRIPKWDLGLRNDRNYYELIRQR